MSVNAYTYMYLGTCMYIHTHEYIHIHMHTHYAFTSVRVCAYL